VGFREKWTGQKAKSKEIKPIDEEETYFKQMQRRFYLCGLLWSNRGGPEFVPKTSAQACCNSQQTATARQQQHATN